MEEIANCLERISENFLSHSSDILFLKFSELLSENDENFEDIPKLFLTPELVLIDENKLSKIMESDWPSTSTYENFDKNWMPSVRKDISKES